MANEIKAKESIRPDDLLVGIGKSIMGKALVYSIIGHLILTIATSIPLFKDWTVYGVKAPSTINAIRTEENRQKEEAERRQKAKEKAEAEAKAAAEAKAKAEEEAKKNPNKKPSEEAKGENAPTNQATEKEAGDGQPKVGADGKIIPPEVQPLPPKKEFEYGDDLSLD